MYLLADMFDQSWWLQNGLVVLTVGGWVIIHALKKNGVDLKKNCDQTDELYRLSVEETAMNARAAEALELLVGLQQQCMEHNVDLTKAVNQSTRISAIVAKRGMSADDSGHDLINEILRDVPTQ